MIDPTFFDPKTKSVLRQKGLNNNYRVYKEEQIVKQLLDINAKRMSKVTFHGSSKKKSMVRLNSSKLSDLCDKEIIQTKKNNASFKVN